jgi:outer membrane beta-barrel protein
VGSSANIATYCSQLYQEVPRIYPVTKPCPSKGVSSLVLGCVCLITAILAWSNAPAYAQSESSSSEKTAKPTAEKKDAWAPIRVYQQRPFMRSGRVEIMPSFGMSLNDLYRINLNAGATLNVHITNEIAIGASYHKYFQMALPINDTVESEFGVFPEHRNRDFYTGGHVSYAPIYGKFMLFQTGIVHFDAYLIGGAGMMRTYQRGAEGDSLFSFNAGVGSRMVFSQWCTFSFEVRDYMYFEPYKAGDGFTNDVIFQLGLSFFLPPHYDYRYVK